MLKSGEESMRPRFHSERDISRGRQREGSRAEQIVPFVRVRGVSQSVRRAGGRARARAGRGLGISKIPFSIQRMAIVSVPPLLPPLSLYSLDPPSHSVQ